jgi:hypothetical protein
MSVIEFPGREPSIETMTTTTIYVMLSISAAWKRG